METMVWWNAGGGSLNKEVEWKFDHGLVERRGGYGGTQGGVRVIKGIGSQVSG